MIRRQYEQDFNSGTENRRQCCWSVSGGLALGALAFLLLHQTMARNGCGYVPHLCRSWHPDRSHNRSRSGSQRCAETLETRSSFWRALLGAVAGLAIGLVCGLTGFGILLMPIPIVAGAVIGSGWGAKPADAAEAQS